MCRRAEDGEKRTAQQTRPRLKETAAKTATVEASLSWHATQGRGETISSFLRGTHTGQCGRTGRCPEQKPARFLSDRLDWGTRWAPTKHY